MYKTLTTFTSRLTIKFCTIVLSTICLATGIGAADQVPFKGHFVPHVYAVTPVDETHVRLEMHVDIQATHLGKAQGPAWAILDVTTFMYVGAATWVAANGDSITIIFEGQFLPTATDGILENIETIEVTGGTGRFEGATGHGVAGGLLDGETLLPLGKGAPFTGSISTSGSLK